MSPERIPWAREWVRSVRARPGAAIGALGGPVGAMIGGLVGVVGGGYAGKGVAESINPTEEDAHWQSNYRNTSYFENDYEYADYAPAYRVGYEGYGRYAAEGRDYADAETDLQRDYTQGPWRISSRMGKGEGRDARRLGTSKSEDRHRGKVSCRPGSVTD